MHPTTPDYPFDLDSKPDSARCLARIEAWFKQAVLDRPPIRFYHHNVEYEGGAALDPEVARPFGDPDRGSDV